MNEIVSRGLIVLLILALPAGLAAQDVDESELDALDKTSPVIAAPAREPPGAVELRAAMRRIAYSPDDPDALADAGNASLTLGDANAALNFFTRANALRPNNGRIVSGLATATVRTENPFEALRLFDDAVRLGISERAIAADRALAFDLLGNFARAQQDYKLARSASSSEDLVVKQAISMSLAGQKQEADAMLVPLLDRKNIGAWRARAFMLAARGDVRESAKVTAGFMDAASVQRMERYLRLMPDLTGAQQAAAIHLGHFPASQNVGRDSDQVRRVASTIPPVVPSASESRLIPAGVPLGTKKTASLPAKNDKKPEKKRDRKAREREEIKIAAAQIPDSIKLPKTDTSRLGTDSARAKVAEAQVSKIAAVGAGRLPAPESARAPVKIGMPAQAQPIMPSQSLPAAVATPTATGLLAADAATVPPAAVVLSQPLSVPSVMAVGTGEINTALVVPLSTSSTADRVFAVQGPMPDGAAVVANSTSTVTAAPPAVQPAAAAPLFDLAAIVGAIEVPDSEKQSVAAVDLTKIKPRLPKAAAVEPAGKNAKIDPKLVAKAKMEAANPARYWVQIATGQASALPFDYGKWAKKSPDLFKKQAGWTAPWGRTSRLLVGPFTDQKAAKKWEVDFKKAGGDSFGWKSEIGEEVSKLKAK